MSNYQPGDDGELEGYLDRGYVGLRDGNMEIGECEHCGKSFWFDKDAEMTTCRHCGYTQESGKSVKRSDLLPKSDAPMETLDNGAKQSAVTYRYDLIDPFALAALAKVLDFGAKKYGDNNWHGIPLESHLNHAVAHVYAFIAEDKEEDHLSHAFTRLMMALAKYLNPNI